MAEEKKNAKAAERQAEVRAEKAVEEVEVTVRDGMFKGLTRGNEDYLFHLNSALDKQGYDSEKKEKVLNEMYLELREKQKQGIVARKLYGTVTERCNKIVNGETLDDGRSDDMPSYWVMALDNGLIMFIMFCVLYAVMGFFTPKANPGMQGGWITLIATSAIAGCGLAFFYRMMAANSKTKGRKKWVKGILVTLELVAIWMIAFGIIAFIPESINRTMNPVVYTILGVAGYLVRRYLKKKLNFQSVAF